MTDESHRMPAMSVTILPDVVPLTGDFGETATVPEALREALFAGEAATYAILDAARMPGLPELLETSGLDHRCLFKGAAEGDLRDVAPWLVRLEEHHPFTRHLFTPGDAPWAMWDREPGIFLRSGAGLDDLRRHFRRFTKMRDAAGKWYYVRFWEPVYLLAYARALVAEKQVVFMGDVSAIIAVTDGEAHVLSMTKAPSS